MVSDLDALGLFGAAPEGLTPGADRASLVTGTLLGLDVPNRAVQVSVAGSEGVWVPAQAAIYPIGAPVRLLRSPLDGGKITACLGPLADADLIVTGQVTAVNTSAGTLTVTALAGSFDVPFNAGTYAVVGAVVHVLRDPAKFGRPVFVLGPQGSFAGAAPVDPGAGAGNPGQSVNRQAVIVPQWSGSWRSSFSRWNSWNTDRYGGPTTLWQGNGSGSGAMTGLATYGDQIVNLGATSITRMQVSVYRADSSFSTGRVAVIQPSTNASQPAGAPSVAGATASSSALAPEQSEQVDLPSTVFAGFLNGTYKGLATVGTDYAGYSGVPSGYGPVHADGFALVVQYTTVA